MPPTFVSYLRVSTSRQGSSGLGLAAQREAVRRHCDQAGGELLDELVEVETGKSSLRPILADALIRCRALKATLVIAKLDRLSRSVSFIAGLMDAKVPFVAVDMPFATPLILHVMAAFAQFEREQIAARTKAALAAAKARGVKLGVHGKVLAAHHKAGAIAFAETVRAEVAAAQATGATTLQSIADHLNANGIPSRQGSGWLPTNVRRVLQRLTETDGPQSAVPTEKDRPCA